MALGSVLPRVCSCPTETKCCAGYPRKSTEFPLALELSQKRKGERSSLGCKWLDTTEMALEAREEGQRNSKWEEFLVGIPIPHIPHQGGWDGNRVYRVLGTELISRKVILSCVCLNPLFKLILFFILSFHLGSFFYLSWAALFRVVVVFGWVRPCEFAWP